MEILSRLNRYLEYGFFDQWEKLKCQEKKCLGAWNEPTTTTYSIIVSQNMHEYMIPQRSRLKQVHKEL